MSDIKTPTEQTASPTKQVEQDAELDRQLTQAERCSILAYKIDEKTDEDGCKHYFPKSPEYEFPFIMDFTLPPGSPGNVRGMEPPFKFTHNIMWTRRSGKPLLDAPEPFPADEFDVRQYLMAYIRTIVQIYGADIKPTPTVTDIENHLSDLAEFISRKSKLTVDEAWLANEPGQRFIDWYPNNFMTKFINSLPEAERKEHPLYYQVVFVWLETTDKEKQCYAYMAHAEKVTPLGMRFLKSLAELGRHVPEYADKYDLGELTYAYYDSVMKFIPYVEDGLVRYPMFRF